jgi:hypothetical protein
MISVRESRDTGAVGGTFSVTRREFSTVPPRDQFRRTIHRAVASDVQWISANSNLSFAPESRKFAILASVTLASAGSFLKPRIAA